MGSRTVTAHNHTNDIGGPSRGEDCRRTFHAVSEKHACIFRTGWHLSAHHRRPHMACHKSARDRTPGRPTVVGRLIRNQQGCHAKKSVLGKVLGEMFPSAYRSVPAPAWLRQSKVVLGCVWSPTHCCVCSSHLYSASVYNLTDTFDICTSRGGHTVRRKVGVVFRC